MGPGLDVCVGGYGAWSWGGCRRWGGGSGSGQGQGRATMGITGAQGPPHPGAEGAGWGLGEGRPLGCGACSWRTQGQAGGWRWARMVTPGPTELEGEAGGAGGGLDSGVRGSRLGDKADLRWKEVQGLGLGGRPVWSY